MVTPTRTQSLTPTRIEPLTSTPALPHQKGGGQRGGGPKATTADPADPAQLIADLQRQLAECSAERDQAREYQTATALRTLPLDGGGPGWG